MTTSIYNELTAQEKWQVSAYGATVEQVREALESYLPRRSRLRVVLDMLNHAWVSANDDEVDEARQTLNRVKLAISDWYGGNERGFFDTDAGRAFSILSDAQELLMMDDCLVCEDTRRVQMCIDQAANLVSAQEGVR